MSAPDDGTSPASSERGQSETTRANARLGTVLRGKYRLDRVLGIGGMAAVYGATHRNGMELAVKVLHQELTARKDIRRRFVREGMAANALRHPAAVKVLDDDVAEDGSAFLVMELLHGETLESVWERCAYHLALDTVLVTGVQLCDLLASAHEHGIVHRDIKPQNLFLTLAGQLKVLDFGIAHLREVTAASATASGMMLGTPTYMSPEQASGEVKRVGPRSDIYGVGATLFTLVSGHLVHEGENAQQVVIRAATTPVRSLASVMPGAPADLVAVIDRALAFDPANRWGSAAEMRDALRLVYTRTFGPMPPAVPLPALTGLAWFQPAAKDSVSNLTTSVPVALSGPSLPRDKTVSTRPPPQRRRENERWTARWVVRRTVGFSLVAAVASGLTYVSLRRHDTVGTAVSPVSTAPPAALSSVPSPVDSSAAPPPLPSSQPAPVDSNAKPRSPSPHHSHNPDCSPPFTVDSRGMHHWKLDCL